MKKAEITSKYDFENEIDFCFLLFIPHHNYFPIITIDVEINTCMRYVYITHKCTVISISLSIDIITNTFPHVFI